MKTEITYKGKTFVTGTPIVHLTDEEWHEIKRQFYQKPPIEEVIAQMEKLHNGKVMINKIIAYYLKELMGDALVSGCKFTVNDIFDCKELLEYAYSKTLLNKKVYIHEEPVKNIDRVLSIGGSAGCVRRVTNFPLKTAREIIQKYNVNGNYYDFSCGWAVRLLGALGEEINYFGTDPNYLLTEKLYELGNLYKQTNNVDSIIDIRTQGSEHFVSEWEGKMGLAFSSPPYFDLEDYKHGDQSINYGNYEAWLEFFVRPTFENIKRYLVKDGFFALNIKNTKKYQMLDDCIEIAYDLGFKKVNEHILKNGKRVSGAGRGSKAQKIFVDTSEKIIVFKLTN